jgi:murein DD-endopeptidase MepM/ murein hydrolase activator NlpD
MKKMGGKVKEYLYQPFREDRHHQRLERRKGRKYTLLLIIIIPLILFAAIYGYRSAGEKEVSHVEQTLEDEVSQTTFEKAPPVQTSPLETLNIIEGEIGKSGTLYDALIMKKVSHQLIEIIISHLRPLVDFQKCDRKDRFTLWINDDGTLVKFTYRSGPLDIYEILKKEDRYSAHKKEIQVDRYLVKICGKIRSSLFEAINEIKEQDQLAIDSADIFAWEIDFYKDLQSGDQFKILVEKIYKGEEFIHYGKILAAEYQTNSRVYRGFYFEGSDGKGDYFDEKGYSLKKAFLRAPLQYSRISSRFSHSRRHPILGGLHPHYGIDYAAPQGTPIWSVADGVIVEKGRSRAYGWYLVIRHPNGYTTYYGHLSKFAKGIRKGTHVEQKQIIGYVGSTGLATGPHLDYRLKRNGRYRDPLKEKFSEGIPVQKQDLKRYMESKETFLNILEDDSFTQTM